MPAASVASTVKVWLPSACPVYAAGLVQAANPPESSLHWKLTPPSVSVNWKAGLESLEGFEGCTVIVGAGGGVVSTDHV